MNILNFMQRFPDETSCIACVKEQRERRLDANKPSFECRHCHGRQSLRSGTAMEHGRLPFRYRIAAMFLLMSTKKSFSTEELRRRPGAQMLPARLENGVQASGRHGQA